MLNTIAPGTGGAGMNTSLLCWSQLPYFGVYDMKPDQGYILDLRPLDHLHRLGTGKYKSKSPTISTVRPYFHDRGIRYEL
jgi:hypothetical protein